jgi:hypothetical protein
MVCCLDKDCGYVDVSDLPATAEILAIDGRERSTDFAINALYVLGFLSCGDGGTEAGRLLGLLGLPNDTTMQSRSFGLIEERISPTIREVTDTVLLDNLTEEVKLTWAQLGDKDETDLDNWKKSITDNSRTYLKSKYPVIDASFDMGWQQRSSGKRYASPSGHAFFVGGLSRRPIAIQVKSKICNFCAAWHKKNPSDPLDDPEEALPVPFHDCTINHVGTSAAMESIAARDMLVDLYDRMHVSIGRICLDDDSSTRAILKWSNADYMNNNNTTVPPQVPKTVGKNKGELHDRPDNGKLPAHVPEPLFVADPNHRKKVLTKDLRTLAAKKSADRFGMSGMDVTRLGKNYGYMMRALKRLPNEDKFIENGQSVLEHHFDNHQYCGAWCPRKRLTEQQRDASARFYRCKKRDAKLYTNLQELFSRFITIERLREVAHSMDTQCNESMNTTPFLGSHQRTSAMVAPSLCKIGFPLLSESIRLV